MDLDQSEAWRALILEGVRQLAEADGVEPERWLHGEMQKAKRGARASGATVKEWLREQYRVQPEAPIRIKLKYTRASDWLMR